MTATGLRRAPRAVPAWPDRRCRPASRAHARSSTTSRGGGARRRPARGSSSSVGRSTATDDGSDRTQRRLRRAARRLPRRGRERARARSSSATCRSSAASPRATRAGASRSRTSSRSARSACCSRSSASTPSAAVQFTTYAVPTIVGEIQRHFRDRAWALHVPRRMKELSLRLTPHDRERRPPTSAARRRSPSSPRRRAPTRTRSSRRSQTYRRVLDALALPAARPGRRATRRCRTCSATTDARLRRGRGQRARRGGLRGARRARAADRRAALLRGPDAVGDRRAGRHLPDARVAAAPPRAPVRCAAVSRTRRRRSPSRETPTV